MARYALLLAFVLHSLCTRSAPAQDSSADTLADSTRSPFHLSGVWLRRLPIDESRHGLVLVPGVRLTGADIGITPVAALSIRGSSTARGNVYVDGAPLRFQTRGGPGGGLELHAIENVAVLTGVAPASFGDAAGGVIAYETRAGDDRLAAELYGRGDWPFSDRSADFNRLGGSVGGPLARRGAMTFMVSASVEGQRASYRGPGAARIPAYLPAGVDTTADTGTAQISIPEIERVNDGSRRPLDWLAGWHVHAKLLYRYGAASRISLSGIAGELQQRFFPGRLAMDPALYTGRRWQSAAVILDWQHALGEWHGGPLRSDVNLSLVRHRGISGPLDSASESETQDAVPPNVMPGLRFAGGDILDLPARDALVRDLRTQSMARVVPFLFVKPRAIQTSRANPYGVAIGWPNEGYGGTLADAAEHRVQGRFAVGWKPSGFQLAVGAEVERSHVSSYSSDVVIASGTDVFTADPRRLGLFSDARFELAGATIAVGARYDRITPGGELPVVPGFIASSGSALWNPNAATDDTAYTNSVARVFRPARSQSALLPRIAFSYPLGTTALRLGYSRNVEPPTWGTFFLRSNSDVTFTAVQDLFGRDIDFAAVNLIEGGARFSRGAAVVDVGVYRKDVPQYVGRITAFQDPRDTSRTIGLNAVTSVAGTHAQGVDVSVDWRRGWFTAMGVYTLARITSPSGGGIAPPIAPVTMHSAAIAAVVQVPADGKPGTVGHFWRGANLAVLVRLQSGEPYTRLQNAGVGTLAPAGGLFPFPVEDINASGLPWLKRVDLRLGITRRSDGPDFSLYLEAHNILDLSNLTSLFAETGGTANAAHRVQTIGDPAAGTGEYGQLRAEASNSGALQPDGTTVDLNSCATWASQANCVALMRVERRFGNGDQVFTLAEQQVTFDAYYRDFFGAWRFYAPGRTIRMGAEFRW